MDCVSSANIKPMGVVMKHLVSWHEECLKNMKLTLEREREYIDNLKRKADDLESSVNFYQAQVTKAKLSKKDGFDREKFMKAKSKL